MSQTSPVRRAALAAMTCVVLCALALCTSWAAKAAKDYVIESLEEMVRESPDDVSVVGLGSWMKGQNYKDPLTRTVAQGISDHDVRLSVPYGTSDADALRLWKNYRTRFKGKVVAGLKAAKVPDDKVALVLESINFYPPPQLHRQIASDAQAADMFLKTWKTVPNLGADSVGALTPKEVKKFTEGIYGEGSLTYIQEYEGQSGQVIYKNYKGEVGRTDVAGDILHDLEEREAYSAAGMINRATHRVDEAQGALTKGKAKLGKYLDRLEQDLRKGASLVGARGDDMPPEVRRLTDRLMSMTDDADAAKLLADKRNRQAIEAYIKQAKDRIFLMETVKNSVDSDKILMQTAQEAMDNPGFLDSFGRLLKSQYLMAGLRGLFAANDLKECYTGYRDNGQAGLALALYKNANLTTAFTEAGLEAVKNGLVLQAAKVDCQDVIKGVISAKGYQTVGDPLPMKRWAGMLPVYTDTGHDAAELVTRRDEVFNKLIYPEAKAELLKRWTKGSQPTSLDKELAQAVFDHCKETIRKGVESWVKFESDSQKSLIKRINDTVSKLKVTPVITPDPPRPEVTVTLRIRLSQDLETYLKTAEKELARLGAVSPEMVVTYKWRVRGPDGRHLTVKGSELIDEQTCRLGGPGEYAVEATVRVSSPTNIFGNWGVIEAQATGSAILATVGSEFNVHVTDEASGLSVNGVKISLKSSSAATQTQTTDIMGYARFPRLKPVVYTMSVETSDYYQPVPPRTLDFSRSDQAPVRLALNLVPKAAANAAANAAAAQGQPARPTVTGLEMRPPKMDLAVGQSECLRVFVHLSDGTTRDVTYEVEWGKTDGADRTLRFERAEPDCGMRVTGLAEGAASLAAAYQAAGRAKRVQAQCDVTVREVRLEVDIDPGTQYWYVGDRVTWEAKVYDLENKYEDKITAMVFRWELADSDGVIGRGDGERWGHVWARDGNYTLTLAGTFTIRGLPGTIVRTKTISLGAKKRGDDEGDLDMGFLPSSPEPPSGQAVVFRNITKGAGPAPAYTWIIKKTFGPTWTAEPGRVDAKGNLTWTFEDEGDYEVTLKVVTADGRKGEVTKDLKVGPGDGAFKNWAGGQVNQIRAAAGAAAGELRIELRKHNGVRWSQWEAAPGGNLGRVRFQAVENGEYCTRGQGMRFTPGWVAYVPQGGDALYYAMFSGRGAESGRVVQTGGRGLVPTSIELEVRDQGLYLTWYNDQPQRGGKIRRERWRATFRCHADDPLYEVKLLGTETLDAPEEALGQLGLAVEVEKGADGKPSGALVRLTNANPSLDYSILIDGRMTSLRPESAGGAPTLFRLPKGALTGYPDSRTSFALEVRGQKAGVVKQRATTTLTMPAPLVEAGRFTVTPAFSPPKADFISLDLRLSGAVKGRTYEALLDGGVLASSLADAAALTLTIGRTKLPAGAGSLELTVRESEGRGFGQKVLAQVPVRVTLPGRAVSGQASIEVSPPASAGGVVYKGDDLTFVAKCDGCDDRAEYTWTICGTRYASSGPRRVQRVNYERCEVKVEVSRRAGQSLGGQQIGRTDTWSGATTVVAAERPAVTAATDYPSSGLWFAVCVDGRCHREDPVRLAAAGKNGLLELYPHLPSPGTTRPTHLDWTWDTSVNGVNRTIREQTPVSVEQAMGQGAPLKAVTRAVQPPGVYKLTLQPVTYWPNRAPTNWGPACTRTITVGQGGTAELGSSGDKPVSLAGATQVPAAPAPADQGWALFTLPQTAQVGQTLTLPSRQDLDARLLKGEGGTAMWFVDGARIQDVPQTTAAFTEGLGNVTARLVFNKAGTYTVKLSVILRKKLGRVFEHEQTVRVGAAAAPEPAAQTTAPDQTTAQPKPQTQTPAQNTTRPEGPPPGPNRAEITGPAVAALGANVVFSLKRGWSGLRRGLWNLIPRVHGDADFQRESFTVPFKAAYGAGDKIVVVRVLDGRGQWHRYEHKVTVVAKPAATTAVPAAPAAPAAGGPDPDDVQVSASLNQEDLPGGKLRVTVSVWVKNNGNRTLEVQKATGDSWAGGRPDGRGWPAEGLQVTTILPRRTATVLRNITVWRAGTQQRGARFNLHTNAGVLASPMVMFSAGALDRVGDGQAAAPKPGALASGTAVPAGSKAAEVKDHANATGGGKTLGAKSGPSCLAGLRSTAGSRDLVGPAETIKGDGRPDAELGLIIRGAAGRTVTAIEVRNTSGQYSVWDTTPANGMWAVGVVRVGASGGQRQDSRLSMPLTKDEERLLLMVCDNGSFKGGRTNYRVRVIFADGATCSCTVQRGGGQGDGGMMESGGDPAQAGAATQPLAKKTATAKTATDGSVFIGGWRGTTWCVRPRSKEETFRLSVWSRGGQLRCNDHAAKGKIWAPCVVREGPILVCPWARQDGASGEYQFRPSQDDPNKLLGVETTHKVMCQEYRYELRRE